MTKLNDVVVEGDFGQDPINLQFLGDAPTGLQIQVLHTGSGDKIPDLKTRVEVNYHGQIWGGKVFDSSFIRGKSITFGLNQVIKGWGEALVGQTVGSRILVSIPPEYGYGSRGVPQAGIGGEDILVFVVDILGIE